LFVGLVTAIGMGSLYAQNQGDGAAAPPAATAPAVRVEMSVVEMANRNTELGKQATLDYRYVLHLQSVARKQKDVIKLTCINDKLVQMKPHVNMLDDQRRELTDLLAAKNDERYPVYDRAVSTGLSVHKLREEASICAGEPEIAGSSDSVVNEPGFPIDPTEGDPFDPGIEDPGYASPFN
jgi:hypothetical protein